MKARPKRFSHASRDEYTRSTFYARKKLSHTKEGTDLALVTTMQKRFPIPLVLLLVLLTLSSVAEAAAPARSGQPYAESICDTDPHIILCEDFDYPANFPCSDGAGSWINPGLKTAVTGTCQGREIDAAANYPPQPPGSPTAGSVKRANVADGEGMTAGCLWGDCLRETADTPTGAEYVTHLTQWLVQALALVR